MKYVFISFFILILGTLGLLNPVRDAVVASISPVQYGLANLAHTTKDAAGFFTNVNSVRTENLTLRKQLQEALEQLAQFKHFRDENELLRQQLELKNMTNNESYILAQIMGNISDLNEGSIVLNKGSREGIRTGAPVTVGKYLIGVVKSVEYSRSFVELITSSGLSFTVYDIDSPSKAAGLAQGRHGSSLSLERILPTEKVSVGDTVVTSGKDGLFAPDLIVGKITEVTDDPSQPLKKAVIETTIDINKLTEAFVAISPR